MPTALGSHSEYFKPFNGSSHEAVHMDFIRRSYASMDHHTIQKVASGYHRLMDLPSTEIFPIAQECSDNGELLDRENSRSQPNPDLDFELIFQYL